MSPIRATNNNRMLIWAREEVGYSLAEAAEAIGVSVATLQAAEEGKHALTLTQLRRAADQYECPLGFFYLSKPPFEKTYKPIPDFRVEPGHIGQYHFRLGLEIKRCRDRRETYLDLNRSLSIELEPFKLLSDPWPVQVGSVIRQRLGIVNRDIRSLTIDEVYPYWKEKIEGDGVLVYESQYIPDASGVIGAAIFYDHCPIILIKRGGAGNDRRLFTLIHEYAHILKGQSAINDASSQVIDFSDHPASGLEALCNKLAAEILVPTEQINPAEYLGLPPVAQMEKLAHSFKVTYTTAAVCLKKFNWISGEEFGLLLDLRRKAHQDNANQRAGEVKIPREILMRLDMGRPMFRTVLEAYSQGILDLYDTSKLLNLRVKKIDNLLGRGS